MKMRALLTGTAAVGALTGLAIGEMGDLVFGPIDVQTQTGETGALGVQFLNDQYFVSFRALVNPPHKVFIFDAAGVMSGSFDQHPDAHTSSWGYRDGMTEGGFLYFGCETGVYRHNADGSNAVEIINGGGPNGNYRGLAYDPSGDVGNGSFWSISLVSNLIEVAMDGTLLNTFANQDGWSVYGMELDPITGNLWAHHRIVPNAPLVVEIDIQDGSPTQGRFTGVQYESGIGGEVQGGLTGVPGGAGGSGNLFDIVVVMQTTPDDIRGHELYNGTCPEDINGDGVVDQLDLLLVLAAWGNTSGPEDINGDGLVNVLDMLEVLGQWGSCA